MKTRAAALTWHEQLRQMQDEHSKQIRSVVRREASAFAEQMNYVSLQAAVEAWCKHMAPDGHSMAEPDRLVRDVRRGRAPESKDIQLIRCALLRATGLDERPAAASAVEAGATYVEIAAVLGMTQQGARKRVRSYLHAAKALAGEAGHDQ